MRGVAEDGPQLLFHVHLQFDVLGESFTGDSCDFAQQMPGLQGNALPLDAPGEGQDLADDAGSPLRTRLHRGQHVPFGVGLCLIPQDGRGHENRGQDVVEIVGDATGQRAQAFEPLRLQEARIELLLFGDVRVDRKDRSRLALLVAHERQPAEHVHHPSALGILPSLSGPASLLEHHRGQRLRGGGIRVDQLGGLAIQRLGASPAINPLRTLVPIEDRVVEGRHINGVIGGVEQGGLLPHFFLRLFALGDLPQ